MDKLPELQLGQLAVIDPQPLQVTALEVHGFLNVPPQFLGHRVDRRTLAVPLMGGADILNDPAQILADKLAEILVLVQMGGAQDAEVGIVLSWLVAVYDLLPHHIHIGVEALHLHTGDPVHINLDVCQQPNKILVGQQFTQQPVVDPSAPQTEIQNCIIYQLRNSSKYVSYKDLKPLMADLKAVYAAVDEQAALDALDTFWERWDKKYPKISQSWRSNWANLSTYFKYPQEVRRLIYTTNAIEGFNRQLRKVTKSKSVFPIDDRLLKMLYLAMMDITKKWTGRRQDWSLIHAQMAIYFAERIPAAGGRMPRAS